MNKSHNALMQAARKLDEDDPLAAKRADFELPSDTVYLDGNSLGPLPISSKIRAQDVIEKQWGNDLITSWNKHAWIDLPIKVGEQIAGLVGAESGQVICCDSISINLFKLITAALALNAPRTKVLTTCDNFPTDGYIVQGIQDLLGDGRCELVTVDEDQIIDSLDASIAVVLLTQVNFRSGNKLCIDTITQQAHRAGALVIWDLAHSAGVIPLQLDQWQVDFAVGCGYKYLNGGPGAPAFVYIARRHQQSYDQPLKGWMGHQQPFEFDPQYKGASGVSKNLVGTPSIISMSVLNAALDVFENLDMDAVFEKSQGLLNTFMQACKALDIDKEFTSITPTETDQRGAQIALQHPQAYAICQALIAERVIADFRRPNILRFGFSPLFLSYADMVVAATRLADIMGSKRYLEHQFQVQHKVT